MQNMIILDITKKLNVVISNKTFLTLNNSIEYSSLAEHLHLKMITENLWSIL